MNRFNEDGEPEETEEKTWEGYDKANEEYNGAIYTYIPVIPESGRDTGRHCFAGDPCAGGRRGDCVVCR